MKHYAVILPFLLFGIGISTTAQRSYNETTKTISATDFHALAIAHASVATIERGEFSVSVTGDADDIADLEFSTANHTFSYKYKSKEWKRHARLTFTIRMPSIESIHLSGASKANIKGFDTERLVFNVSGASRLETTDTSIKKAEADLSGASEAKIRVQELLKARLSGASHLDAKEMATKIVTIEGSGASKIKVYAQDVLRANLSGASHVVYRGDARVEVKTTGASSVHRD